MRRSVFLLSPVIPLALGGLALVGCEDGPDQTFSPAPSNAAAIYNSSANAVTADPGSQDFDAGGGGTNAVNICTPAEQAKQWATAFNAPIIPPFSVGGMDLSTGGTFDPYTIEDAEQGAKIGSTVEPQLCQGAVIGTCNDGTANPQYSWGPSNQLLSCYDIATHQLTFFDVYPGYDGKMTFTLPATFNGAKVARNTTGKDMVYVWQVGYGVTLDGAPLDLKWSATGADRGIVNQLYLAMMYTFQPTLLAITDGTKSPPLNEMTDPNYDCLVSTKCRTSANSDKSAGNIGARPVGVYANFAQSNSGNAVTAAEPSDIYMYPVKFVPYSLSSYNEGLDTFVAANADPNLKQAGAAVYGPYAPAGILGGKTTNPFCTLYMGETWADFTKNCVNVIGDHGKANSQDDLSIAKLLGAQHHTAEWFQFSVVGVNQNFSADTAELTQNGLPSVLPDTAGSIANPPHADDVATNFIVDVRASGSKLNDMRGDTYPATTAAAGDTLAAYEDAHGGGQDFHGTAAVMGYFRQLVHNDLQKQMALMNPPVKPITDPTQCWYPDSYTGNPLAWLPPVGCTGWEQLAVPAISGVNGIVDPPGALPSKTLDLGPKLAIGFGLKSIFQPGDPILLFVSDAPNGLGASYIDEYATAGNLFQAALQQTLYMIGHGDLTNLPSDTRDWRYYFKFWAQAFNKYLLNRGATSASGKVGDITWQELYADDLLPANAKKLRQINNDQLFFDLNNGLDKFEYVDRTQANRLGAPVDFEYDVLLNTSNVQDNNFYQRLEREEKALYQTMLGAQDYTGASITKKTDVPGSNDNINLSDLFGAPAVNALGVCTTGSATVAAKDGFYCCTHANPSGAVDANGTLMDPDPDCGDGNGPPKDSTGNVMIDGQGRPLFTNYHGIFTGTQWTIGAADAITIATQLPYIASALVNLSNYANPYDLSSKNTPLTNTLVPWIPYQPTNGFEIPINAERSQFIQTGSLDFSGVTITMNVDYIPDAADPTKATIAAVETQDFLGEVFPCVDPSTGDLLRVKMYTGVLVIQDWLQQHPGAQSACGIYIRYSPYDNYADYVVSNKYGVYLSVEPGAAGGAARIGDATLFNPSLLTQTQ